MRMDGSRCISQPKVKLPYPQAEVGTLENVKILADTSSVEVFVNDGEFVFSTRYYPNDYKIVVHSPNAHITFDKIQ